MPTFTQFPRLSDHGLLVRPESRHAIGARKVERQSRCLRRYLACGKARYLQRYRGKRSPDLHAGPGNFIVTAASIKQAAS